MALIFLCACVNIHTNRRYSYTRSGPRQLLQSTSTPGRQRFLAYQQRQSCSILLRLNISLLHRLVLLLIPPLSSCTNTWSKVCSRSPSQKKYSFLAVATDRRVRRETRSDLGALSSLCPQQGGLAATRSPEMNNQFHWLKTALYRLEAKLNEAPKER